MTYAEALDRIRCDTIMRTGRYPDKTHELQMHPNTWQAVDRQTMDSLQVFRLQDLEVGTMSFLGFPVTLVPTMAEGDLALAPKKERP